LEKWKLKNTENSEVPDRGCQILMKTSVV